MQVTFREKIKLKWIYAFRKIMGLEYIAGHLVATYNIDKNAKIVDLGGNLGLFSYEMNKRYGCKCYCVEPDPRLFEKIPAGKGIKKYNVAVMDTDGQMNFTLSENSEANSFNPVIASLWGKGKVINVQTWSLKTLKREIEVDNISLLKIDIEGSEVPFLKNLSDEELLNIPQITIEFHECLDVSLKNDTLNIIKRMKELGFIMMAYSKKNFSDVLFLNKKLIKVNWRQRLWNSLY
ncbi:MAG: FkbM family methyltransferase [Chitinophagaceae bacterium]